MGKEDKDKKFEKLTDDRQKFLGNLYKLLKNEFESDDLEKINTIAIDSSWGTGKTCFAEALEEYIDKNNKGNFKIKTLKFNAWENDYYEDPMKTLIGEMNAQNIFNSELKEKAEKIIKNSLKSGLKVLSTLLLRKFNLTNDDVNAIKELFGGVNESSLSDYKNYKTMVDDFKSCLQNEDLMSKEVKNKIIIVDELDRCRPDFAIETLETIKHIFSVKGIIFIFMVNKKLLNSSVETLYGNINDDEEYFKKFFDIEFKLPELKFDNYLQKEYQESVNLEQMRIEDDKNVTYELGKYGIYVFLKTLESLNVTFSPREQKLMLRKFKILYVTFDEEEKSNLDFLIFISTYILYIEKNKDENLRFLQWFSGSLVRNKEDKNKDRLLICPSKIEEHLEELKLVIDWCVNTSKFINGYEYLKSDKGTYCTDSIRRKTNIDISNIKQNNSIGGRERFNYNVYFPNIGNLTKENLQVEIEKHFKMKYDFVENMK